MFKNTWILAILPLAIVHCGGSGGGGVLVTCDDLCELTIACGLVEGLDTATCIEGCSGDADAHQGGSDCHTAAGGNDCAAFGQCLSETLGGDEETGDEETGDEETGAEETGVDLGFGSAIDCDEYCDILGGCAGEWGLTEGEVVPSCILSCYRASAAEQTQVASCVDASEDCTDIYACIPRD